MFVIRSGDLWLPGHREPRSTRSVVFLNSLQHAKLDILKAEKSGNLRKNAEGDFSERKIVPCRRAATGKVANRKKAEKPQEKQNPESIDLQRPGESKWRDSNPRPFGPEFPDSLRTA